MKFFRWLRWRSDDEFSREIQAHLDLEIQANLDRGMGREEARAAALRRFGNITRARERAREGNPFFMLRSFLKDVFYGVRALCAKPGFAVAAVASLALGIGANTLIFSIVRAALLKPLPYPEPDRLAVIWTTPSQKPDQTGSSSVSTYFDLRDTAQSFEAVGAFNGGGCGVRSLGAERDGTSAERLLGQCFSPSLFGILGLQPTLGRVFTEAEDQVENVAPVALISYALWQRRFAHDPGIIGTTVSLNRTPVTIIGVLPPEFSLFRDVNFPATRTSDLDFIVPLEMTRNQVQSRVGGLTIVGRLKPGKTIEQAQAELDFLAVHLAASDPDRHQGLALRVQSAQQAAFGKYRPRLLLLEGAVACVLLIACANVAGLLLARTTSRSVEIALRLTLGASRGRVVRQLVAENLPLALLGGLIGVGLAWAGLQVFIGLAPQDFPRLNRMALDLRVLGFTAVLVLAASLLCSILPAIQAARIDLKQSSRSTTGGVNRQRARRFLVAGQIASSLVLLMGAGLLIRGFMDAVRADLGADPRNVLTFDFRLSQSETARQAGRYRGLGLWEISPGPAQKFERVLDRLQAVPGVVSAAAINQQPLGGSAAVGTTAPFQIEGRPSRPEQQTAAYFAITRDYFATMRIPLLAGRDLTVHDDSAGPPVAIINQTLARQYFPTENPIGQRIILDFAPDDRAREIIGVAGDTVAGPLSRQSTPAVYVPHLQQTSKAVGPSWYLRSGLFFVVRTTGTSTRVLPAIQRAVAEMDPTTPVGDPRTVDDILGSQTRELQLYVWMLSLFAGVAVILAATGIYGVTAYAVVERTREIGIRIALGASKQDITLMVLRQAAGMVAVGLIAGGAGALLVRPVAGSVFSGTGGADSLTYIAVTTLLLCAVLAACIVPTRRATAVNPNQALKYE